VRLASPKSSHSGKMAPDRICRPPTVRSARLAWATELDQLVADRPGFIKPGCDRDPRLELGGLGCPDAEKPFSLAFRVHAGWSILADRGPDVDKCQSGSPQAGLPCRPENSPARLGRLINPDDDVAPAHDAPTMMRLLQVVPPQPCRGHRRSARPKRHSSPELKSPEGRLRKITPVMSTLPSTPRSQS
jgi:hypothetical protein